MSLYLLFRSTDQLVLAVSWSGVTVTGGTPPTLTATAADARLILTLPPQHVGEQSLGETEPVPSRPLSGMMAGPSTVALALPPGAVVALTIDGVLAALRQHSITPDGTAIELPWGLMLAPAGAASCELENPPTDPSAGAAVWHARVRPAAGVDGPLPVRATGSVDDPAFAPALREDSRSRLVAETGLAPALASRLELSTLGGTLDVTGAWDDFEWEQHCVLGRDTSVRVLASGRLYPFGHRARRLTVTKRCYDAAGRTAVLRTTTVLTVTEPVRRTQPNVRRGFPFSTIELTTTVFEDVQTPPLTKLDYAGVGPVPTYAWVQNGDGTLVQFPVRATSATGTVQFAVPLLFVDDLDSLGIDTTTNPVAVAALFAEYGQHPLDLPAATPLDLTGGTGHGPGDVHEVHALVVAGVPAELATVGGFGPALAGMRVRLPELRTLLNEADDVTRAVRYADGYLRGVTEDVMLAIADDASKIDVNFTAIADRAGALAAPRYVADALSRTVGPVRLDALPDADGVIRDLRKWFGDGGSILGYPLFDLLGEHVKAPKIVSDLAAGRAPQVTMEWSKVSLKAAKGFVTKPDAAMDITVKAGPGENSTTCTLTHFGLQFPPTGPVLRLEFGTVVYTQREGQPPDLDIDHVDPTFMGDLAFVEELRNAIDIGSAAKYVDVTPTSIAVHYTYTAPPIPFGAFTMRNIAMSARLTVPYDGSSVTLTLGFSSRANPFQLSVLMFGGSGYAELELNKDGIQRVEAALEFGAMMAVDFVVARGEVHVLGGVRFTLQPNGTVSITGYLRMGGSVNVLGLISVSVELTLELTYDGNTKALVGRATLVLTLDLTLWSDSVELDTGTWTLAGGGGDGPPSQFAVLSAAPYALDDPGFAAWQRYRGCFAGAGAT